MSLKKVKSKFPKGFFSPLHFKLNKHKTCVRQKKLHHRFKYFIWSQKNLALPYSLWFIVFLLPNYNVKQLAGLQLVDKHHTG